MGPGVRARRAPCPPVGQPARAGRAGAGLRARGGAGPGAGGPVARAHGGPAAGGAGARRAHGGRAAGRRLRAGKHARTPGQQASRLCRTGSSGAGRRDPGQLDLGAAALAFHGRPAWPRALPGGASDQSAVPGAGRGNRAGALDRRRLRRASAQPVGRGRPAAHRDAARDRRLRRQPAAGRAAARGVPAGGRRLCRRRGRGHLHPRRFGAALGLHGPVRDHRPERPGRRARLRRTLRRHVRRDVRVHDPARALERRHAGPRRGAAPRAFARRRAGPAPDLARPAPDGTGRAQERLRQGRELP